MYDIIKHQTDSRGRHHMPLSPRSSSPSLPYAKILPLFRLSSPSYCCRPHLGRCLWNRMRFSSWSTTSSSMGSDHGGSAHDKIRLGTNPIKSNHHVVYWRRSLLRFSKQSGRLWSGPVTRATWASLKALVSCSWPTLHWSHIKVLVHGTRCRKSKVSCTTFFHWHRSKLARLDGIGLALNIRKMVSVINAI